MKIGIDIDGVLTNSTEFLMNLASKYCYFNKIYGMNKITEPTISNVFNWSNEQKDAFFDENLEDFYSNNPVRLYASEVISLLKDKGYEIIIITAKTSNYFYDEKLTKKYQNIVKEWLNKNNIIYDEIIFTKDNKKDICLDKNIDIMIDDEEKNIIPISKHIPVICFDNVYNQDIKGPNIIRCYNWYNILANIDNLFDNK